MVVIDPMHNLYLGTTKATLKHWMASGLLTEDHLKDISHEANEMKLWTFTLSLAVLKDRLPPHDLEIWQLFVQANSFVRNTRPGTAKTR